MIVYSFQRMNVFVYHFVIVEILIDLCVLVVAFHLRGRRRMMEIWYRLLLCILMVVVTRILVDMASSVGGICFDECSSVEVVDWPLLSITVTNKAKKEGYYARSVGDKNKWAVEKPT